MTLIRAAALLLPLATACCAGLDRQDQGILQPQSVDGPCQVKKFYILGFTAVHTDMTVAPSGQACTFTVLNPDLQIFPAATLLTRPASHGTASTVLTQGARQVSVSYTPQPGYTGPDAFTVTIEPNDHAIAVAVAVR